MQSSQVHRGQLRTQHARSGNCVIDMVFVVQRWSLRCRGGPYVLALNDREKLHDLVHIIYANTIQVNIVRVKLCGELNKNGMTSPASVTMPSWIIEIWAGNLDRSSKRWERLRMAAL